MNIPRRRAPVTRPEDLDPGTNIMTVERRETQTQGYPCPAASPTRAVGCEVSGESTQSRGNPKSFSGYCL